MHVERAGRPRPFSLWALAVLVAIGLALLPFDHGSSLAHLHVSDWALPERIYRLIKPAILWAGLGTVAGLAGAAARAPFWGGVAVAGFVLVAPFVAGSLTWADTVEVLALLPGLAAGTWLGGRSRMAEVPNEMAPGAEASLASEAGKPTCAPQNASSRENVPSGRKPPGTPRIQPAGSAREG